MTPAEVSWQILTDASDVQKGLNQDWVQAQKPSFKKALCDYFSACGDCDKKHGNVISRVDTTADGGKVLKVRWLYPGCGKRGGLRIIVSAHCDQRVVKILSMGLRRDA